MSPAARLRPDLDTSATLQPALLLSARSALLSGDPAYMNDVLVEILLSGQDGEVAQDLVIQLRRAMSRAGEVPAPRLR